jgi:hypothetical protein
MTAPMHSASKSHQRFCCEDFDPRKKQLSLFNCESNIHLSTTYSVFNGKHTVPQVIALFWHQHLNLNKIQIVEYIPKFTQCHHVHFALSPLQSHLDTLAFHKSQRLVTMVTLVTCVINFIATTVTIIVYMVNITFQWWSLLSHLISVCTS